MTLSKLLFPLMDRHILNLSGVEVSYSVLKNTSVILRLAGILSLVCTYEAKLPISIANFIPSTNNIISRFKTYWQKYKLLTLTDQF